METGFEVDVGVERLWAALFEADEASAEASLSVESTLILHELVPCSDRWMLFCRHLWTH